MFSCAAAVVCTHACMAQSCILSVLIHPCLAVQRKTYLIDRRTGVVYENIKAGTTVAWPRPVGVWDRMKRLLHLKPRSANSGAHWLHVLVPRCLMCWNRFDRHLLTAGLMIKQFISL
jgi:hypothetical protein